ncbi:MAG: hypothetical protein APF84_01445 [Gracilibacter sp. BRH_c7a]|nr:MAG: hypothetical protein APF84_01445 [Gracilibacter sp. BRH_c7a]
MCKQITLILKTEPSLPVEAENITPDNLSSMDATEINNLLLWYGNEQRKLSEFFTVEISEVEEVDEFEEGTPLCHTRIIIKGDLIRFKRLGEGMSSGELLIEGSVGFHTGALMKGGTLIVRGNAGDWLGAQMEGGKIIVQGSAGHFIGSGYRGNPQGMRGGMILINGDAGQMVGSRMRRGVIAINGNCGDAPGYRMLAGTLLIGGVPGIRVGANMKRGTIILLKPGELLLPTFYYNCTYRCPVWGLLYRELKDQGFNLQCSNKDIYFKRYSGDGNEGGKGEILTCHSH